MCDEITFILSNYLIELFPNSPEFHSCPRGNRFAGSLRLDELKGLRWAQARYQLEGNHRRRTWSLLDRCLDKPRQFDRQVLNNNHRHDLEPCLTMCRLFCENDLEVFHRSMLRKACRLDQERSPLVLCTMPSHTCDVNTFRENTFSRYYMSAFNPLLRSQLI